MKIVLDAGHGGFGVTPGKRSPDGSFFEWDFNGPTVELIYALLLNYQNVEVKISSDRSGKTDTPLEVRVATANKWPADLFVSIHANASGDTWSDATGIETYTYTTQPKAAENLAISVQKSLLASTHRKNRGVKAADFYVLRKTNMTAILVECEFMTNHESLALLKSSAYKMTVAKAIVQAIVETYGLKPKTVPTKKPAVKVATAQTPLYKVQMGAFGDKDNAQKLVNELNEKGYHPIITTE